MRNYKDSQSELVDLSKDSQSELVDLSKDSQSELVDLMPGEMYSYIEVCVMVYIVP